MTIIARISDIALKTRLYHAIRVPSLKDAIFPLLWQNRSRVFSGVGKKMRQQLVQEQKLERKMTQTLIQSIQLLQLTGVELIEYIKQLAKENPLIEEVNDGEQFNDRQAEQIDPLSIGDINRHVPSMYEQLKNQLYTLSIPDNLRTTIDFGIDSITEEGYLDIDEREWAELCGASLVEVEEALAYIQMLAPLGIGARSLSECLYLQLQDKTNIPGLHSLIYDHLDWIADADINSITETYMITETEANTLLELVKTCDPYPGLRLENKQPDYIFPEASIIKQDGEWQVAFYQWAHPSITIDPTYEKLRYHEDAATYLKEKYNQIDWLRQAISYRTNTLELIIKQILSRQYLFFEHGSSKLQPLTLKEIAEELDLSISTVSRTVSHKYVQTSQGVIPLKFFFQSGVRQGDNQNVSAYAIQQLMVELIKNENKTQPLSDEAIKNQLQEEFKINIARRTVRKYRTQLNIPPSTKRK